MQRGYLLTIFLLILALIFAIQNTASISLKFLVWHFDGSQAFVTVLIFFLGCIAGWMFGLRNNWKKNKQIRNLTKQVSELSLATTPPPTIN